MREQLKGLTEAVRLRLLLTRDSIIKASEFLPLGFKARASHLGNETNTKETEMKIPRNTYVLTLVFTPKPKYKNSRNEALKNPPSYITLLLETDLSYSAINNYVFDTAENARCYHGKYLGNYYIKRFEEMGLNRDAIEHLESCRDEIESSQYMDYNLFRLSDLKDIVGISKVEL